jgi:hypothetical protein
MSRRMPYAGLPDAAARADLIAYLQKAIKQGASGARKPPRTNPRGPSTA